MGRITRNLQIPRVAVTDAEVFINTRPDSLAVEEPLEIRVNGTSRHSTMRTPGQDIELLHGWLLGEGLIRDATEVATARYCAGAVGPDNQNTYNLLDVEVAGVRRELAVPGTGPGCALPGDSPVEELRQQLPWPATPIAPDPRMLITLPGKIRARRKLEAKTGGVHAAALIGPDGELHLVREDIDAGNAADKVIGRMLLDGLLPAPGTILALSSGASFGLLRRAAMAGIPGVVTKGPATSLAVDAARGTGLFLGGQLRENHFSHYAGELG